MIAGLLAVLACAPDPRGRPAPAAGAPMRAEALGLELEGAGWALGAATAELVGGVARAAEPTLRVEGTPGAASIEVTARTTTWDLAGGRATFTGEVRLVRGDVTLRAEVLEVQVASDGVPALRALTARGSVRVAQGARTARAGEAALDPATGMLVLRAGASGERPRLTEGTTGALEGAVVSIALDDARATCEGDAGGPCRLVLAAAP
jgi:lipopolysaccharide export system protein LptA